VSTTHRTRTQTQTHFRQAKGHTVASDEISLRLEEIVESLNLVLTVTEDLPPDAAVARVTGPAIGVTRDFKYQLANVATVARVAAQANKRQIRELADAVVTTVNEFEATDQISGTQADQLEAQLLTPEPTPVVTSTHYTPAPSPGSTSPDRNTTSFG